MDVDYGAMSVSQLMAMYEEQGDTCTHQHDGSDDDQDCLNQNSGLRHLLVYHNKQKATDRMGL